MKLRQYRIVKSGYRGYYEVQQWRVWWPFWTYIDDYENLHESIERAEYWLKNRKFAHYVGD